LTHWDWWKLDPVLSVPVCFVVGIVHGLSSEMVALFSRDILQIEGGGHALMVETKLLATTTFSNGQAHQQRHGRSAFENI
jgi:hypothetical protein